MKKVFLSLAVLATVALVSCGDKKAENGDSATMVEETEVAVVEGTDTTAGDTANVEAAAAEATETPAEAPAETPAGDSAK